VLGHIGAIGPPHESEPTAEAVRSRQLELARRYGWPQLDREELVFDGRGIVEHKPTGRFFVLCRGELTDALYTAAEAFFVDATGTVRFLETPAGYPKTRAELDQRRAERAARR
jgi:hypothetical protein